MDVHAAFVSECTGSDERLVRAEVHVGDFVDVARQLGEMLGAAAAEHLVAALLECEVGDHRHQVGIAAAFAEAVDRALHVDGPGVDGGERIGHGQIAIVVGVDAQRHVRQRRPLPW